LLVSCGLKVSGLPSMQTTRLLLKAGDAADIKIANAPTETTDFITLKSLGYCCRRRAVSECCSPDRFRAPAQ
jgi:hypothetical protein